AVTEDHGLKEDWRQRTCCKVLLIRDYY
nr:hypothetical protein [Tanacetum cinerariifolium]